jgi:hypothetical protein
MGRPDSLPQLSVSEPGRATAFGVLLISALFGLAPLGGLAYFTVVFPALRRGRRKR